MSSEIKTSSLEFGTVIAFVAPGFVGFYAVSYHVATARAWLDAASNKEQTVGVFLLVLLASIAIGLILSGVRQLVIDRILCSRWLGGYALPRLNLDWSQIDDKNLSVLTTIRDGYYWYYQFYSNSCIALTLLLAARAKSSAPGLHWWQWAVISFGVVALLLSARYSLQRYGNALSQAFDRPKEDAYE